MQLPSNTSILETLVGGAVVALAAGFYAYAYNTAGLGSGASADGYRLIAEFDNAEGINIGTDVRLAGIKIGTVTNQSLNTETYQARIEMTLDKSVLLADDTAAKVTSEGLLGAKFIALDPGGSDTKFADGGTFSYTQGAVDIWGLIGNAMFEKSGGKSGSDATPEKAPETTPEPAPEATPEAPQ